MECGENPVVRGSELCAVCLREKHRQEKLEKLSDELEAADPLDLVDVEMDEIEVPLSSDIPENELEEIDKELGDDVTLEDGHVLAE